MVFNPPKIIFCRRSPCGERGLKFSYLTRNPTALMSLPVRGAWIEMSPARGSPGAVQSLPVRGAWIEMRRCMGGG